MHVPTPRQAPRRHTPVRAALFTLLGLLAAACGAPEEPQSAAGPESQEVMLQPVGTAGPDPFTATSATGESAPAQPPLPNPTGQGIRTVGAATPGLYAGTKRLGSCDVEQQLRALTEDDAKAKAFAEAVSVETAKLPEFLRGLTPVVLRADTRVTNHAFRGGKGEAFQSVLQAGTAVLVDDHGMPRVRCACGNPLQAPRAPKGSPALKGDQWSGYQAQQVIVIEPTPHPVKSLVLVNIADNTWMERKTGDDGAQDSVPQPVPAFDPANGIPTGPVTPPAAAAPEPCAPPETDAGAGTNGLARTAPPAPPKPQAGPGGVPAPEATDCVPARSEQTGPDQQSRPDRQAGPDQQTRPDQPAQPSPAAPQKQRPGQPPAAPRSDVPPDRRGDAPADAFGDPGLAPEADGPVPRRQDRGDPFTQDDPFGSGDDPFAPSGQDAPYDPFGGPDRQQTLANPARSLGSA
ncbi:DUF6777 domain-containing protein [Streptomyces sp. NPDC056485]|uniref:DUF6777 domain-containing protein n=1 Tax=Streptomyces sp. NPDC056485 TaxID=3345834 RepID=UPI0036C14475